MTWKCLWSTALVAAATLGSASGAWAQVVQVAEAVPAGYGWDDSDPSLDAVNTPNEPTPAPKRPPIGAGLDELASPSPSDLPPTPQGDLGPVPYEPGCDGVYAPTCGAEYGDVYAPASCCCGPRWLIRAEYLLLQRGRPENVDLFAPGVGVGYGADDATFDFEGGARLTLIRNNIWNSCWDLELAWFGVHGWNDRLAGEGPGNFLTTPVTVVAAAGPVTTDYLARLDSGEINFRRRTGGMLTWLVGLRTFESAEDLNTDIDSGTATHRVDVNNHLYGVQVGAEALLWDQGGPWRFDGVAKLGVYHNSADVTTTTAGIGGAQPLIVADGDETAFAAELGFHGVYCFTPQLSGRVGYNLLWLDGVASAPSQLATTNIATGLATVNFSDTQFYHGFSFGLDYVW